MLTNTFTTRTYEEEMNELATLAAYLEYEGHDDLKEKLTMGMEDGEDENGDPVEVEKVVEEIYKELDIDTLETAIYIKIAENNHIKNAYVYLPTDDCDWLYWARSESYGKNMSDEEIVKKLIQDTEENLVEHMENRDRAANWQYDANQVYSDVVLYM